MKRILSICIVVSALCAVSAKAQFQGGIYGSQSVTLTNTPTGVITNATVSQFILPPATNATGVAPAIPLRNNKSVAFQLTAIGAAASTDPVTAVFVTSLDGVHWDTSTTRVLTLTLAGHNTVTVTTNFTL